MLHVISDRSAFIQSWCLYTSDTIQIVSSSPKTVNQRVMHSMSLKIHQVARGALNPHLQVRSDIQVYNLLFLSCTLKFESLRTHSSFESISTEILAHFAKDRYLIVHTLVEKSTVEDVSHATAQK